MYSSSDTIAAIITPAGIGGVSVIRVSGAGTLDAVAPLFRGANLRAAAPNTIHHGYIISHDGETVDEALCSIFRAPHSYTGEDVVEISCHGNPIVAGMILDLLLGRSVRLAEPGEFTLRAFLNERIDLTQAEAVADIVQAGSINAIRASNTHLRGALREAVEETSQNLVKAVSLLELELDFVEEGITLVDSNELLEILTKTQNKILQLINSYKSGRLFVHGAKIAIVGKPNAGKSSLLNALLQEERVIVSPIPGTTRDVIEAAILHNGLKLSFFDTAGVWNEAEGIETLGIEKTFEQIRSSDLMLAIVDLSKKQIQEDLEYCTKIVQQSNVSRETPPIIYVLNKSDVANLDEKHEISAKNVAIPAKNVVISAKTGDGINNLKDCIVETLNCAQINQSDLVLTNRRQYDCFVTANRSLEHAIGSLGKISSEFIAADIRKAIDALGEITGKVTSQDILNSIFVNFCIGK